MQHRIGAPDIEGPADDRRLRPRHEAARLSHDVEPPRKRQMLAGGDPIHPQDGTRQPLPGVRDRDISRRATARIAVERWMRHAVARGPPLKLDCPGDASNRDKRYDPVRTAVQSRRVTTNWAQR